jgi:hypothetical protein
LGGKGEDKNFINHLLEDSGIWNAFRERLHLHVEKSREVLRNFQENRFLYEEVRREGEEEGKGKDIGAIKELAELVERFEQRGEKEISKLDEKTRDLIALVRKFSPFLYV